MLSCLYIYIFCFCFLFMEFNHHHHLPQWSNIKVSSSRSVTASNFYTDKKTMLLLFLYAFVNVCICMFVYALFLGNASFVRYFTYISLKLSTDKNIQSIDIILSIYSYYRKRTFLSMIRCSSYSFLICIYIYGLVNYYNNISYYSCCSFCMIAL